MGATPFNTSNSADLVAGRIRADAGGALPAFLHSLIDHVHAIVRETHPSRADWRRAIEFLTEVGHASDSHRQEWVLLSDLLGVTALVEELNSKRPKAATPNTVRGPFYRADAPKLPLGASISLDGVGEPLEVSGTVRDLDGHPVAGAVIETWQANAAGFYENQQPDLQPEFNLRGVFQTDAAGAFRYRTVKPGGVLVPRDGPVGRVLGEMGFSLRRPAHLHFLVKADGFETISTHVYDGRDPHLGEDALFGVKPELIGDIRRKEGGEGWQLGFAFAMVRERRGRGKA